ncbi:MAG TPA: aminotransferase class IV [Casimicrobiaceae bacterium]|nr:aminotransferase class IV [Casimicrobiaceae bacterium]
MTPTNDPTSASSQGYVDDPRNDDVLVYLNGELVPRERASVSVFDSGFVLGDGIWESLRLVDGRLVALDRHMDRLYDGARALALDIGMPRDALVAAIRDTLERNGMRDGVHVRIMITRGRKKTPNQDPRFALGRATIVIVAEYKQPNPSLAEDGLSLFTSSFRCSTPDVFDLRLNTHSRLNLIQALIQAINAGADEALMLDPHGFVASCNSTNFFVVRRGELWTSTGRYNFMGITRAEVIELYRAEGGVVRESDFTLSEVYTADEAFATGTLGGITPVTRVDGRAIGNGRPGPMTRRVDELYREAIMRE